MVNKVFELNNLTGVNGVIMNGIAVDDQSGTSVSSAGDVNGDGIGDVIIGARYADPHGKGYPGQSYLVFGQLSWTSPLALSNLDGANGVIINGIEARDASGYFVSAAGDINGDGVDDVIIGAYPASPNGKLAAGQSYLVFGQLTWTSPLELSSLDGANGVIINGIAAEDWSGLAVSSAGDVNGDGIEDVIIGAPLADPNGKSRSGQSYLVFGQSTWTSPLELSSLNGANGVMINGIAAHDRSGYSVSAAGDINGDRVDDVIIGARSADPNGLGAAGQSYLVFGQSTWTSPLELSSLNGANGVIMNGIVAYDESSYSVSGADDINGDGVDDVIIGAYRADPNGKSGAGQSYLVFGQSTWTSPLDLSSLDGVNGVIMNGIEAGDQSGYSVSSAGDVNGDGIGDVIIGAHKADPNGTLSAGQSYVVFGQSAWTSPLDLSSLDGVNGVTMNGIAAGDQSGYSVSSAGDVNGDGIDDVIIGARYADPNGTSGAGQSYLLFGGAEPFSDNQLSIHPGETLPLNARDLAVEPIIGHRIFTVSEVEQGQFELKSNPGMAITQFTQQQIMEGDVLFVHNGSNIAPSYVVEANSITRIFSDVKPQSANVSFIMEPSTSIQPATTTTTPTTTEKTTATTSSTTISSTTNSLNASSANTSTLSTTQSLDSVPITIIPTPTTVKTTEIRDSTSPSDFPETENKNNAPKNNATVPIAAGVAVGVAALAVAGLFAWRRHQRRQNATLPSRTDVRIETVEMAHNPLHPSTGRRVWDEDQYAINGEERSQTREWDAGTYAIRENQPVPLNDERWNPTLYGAGGNNAQIHRREWDPALYETGTDASGDATYAVPFEGNQDPEIIKVARRSTVRK